MDEVVEVNPPLSLLYRIHPDGRRGRIENYGDTDSIPNSLEGRPLSDAHVFWRQNSHSELKMD